MDTLFEGVSLAGIVEPGQFYMLFDSDCGSVEGEIELMYFIRSEDELLETLRMEREIVLPALYTGIEFLGVRQVTKDRHLFSIFCINENDREVRRYLFLQRLKPYDEMLVHIKEVFLKSTEAEG
jgi:hypothetical protein